MLPRKKLRHFTITALIIDYSVNFPKTTATSRRKTYIAKNLVYFLLSKKKCNLHRYGTNNPVRRKYVDLGGFHRIHDYQLAHQQPIEKPFRQICQNTDRQRDDRTGRRGKDAARQRHHGSENRKRRRTAYRPLQPHEQNHQPQPGGLLRQQHRRRGRCGTRNRTRHTARQNLQYVETALGTGACRGIRLALGAMDIAGRNSAR